MDIYGIWKDAARIEDLPAIRTVDKIWRVDGEVYFFRFAIHQDEGIVSILRLNEFSLEAADLSTMRYRISAWECKIKSRYSDLPIVEDEI
jgi:hypothetical protein